MIIFGLGAAALLYPLKKFFFSISGMDDYLKSASHLLHGRFTKAGTSFALGLTKLSLSAGLIYLAMKPLFSQFHDSRTKPSDIHHFKPNANLQYISRILYHKSYENESGAAKLAEFCINYFKHYPLTYYDIAKNCVEPFTNRKEGPLSDWILEKPLLASSQIALSADCEQLREKASLQNCTESNIASQRVFDAKEKLFYKPSKQKTECENFRMSYLKALLEQPNEVKAHQLATKGCAN